MAVVHGCSFQLQIPSSSSSIPPYEHTNTRISRCIHQPCHSIGLIDHRTIESEKSSLGPSSHCLRLRALIPSLHSVDWSSLHHIDQPHTVFAKPLKPNTFLRSESSPTIATGAATASLASSIFLSLSPICGTWGKKLSVLPVVVRFVYRLLALLAPCTSYHYHILS